MLLQGLITKITESRFGPNHRGHADRQKNDFLRKQNCYLVFRSNWKSYNAVLLISSREAPQGREITLLCNLSNESKPCLCLEIKLLSDITLACLTWAQILGYSWLKSCQKVWHSWCSWLLHWCCVSSTAACQRLTSSFPNKQFLLQLLEHLRFPKFFQVEM